MAVEFERLRFTKNWNNSSDFPTYEENEQKVREDLQLLHDETKVFINETLIPGIENMAVPGTGDMLQDIYDTERKRTDVFQYADDAVSEHLQQNNHVDAYDKNESISRATKDALGLAEDATPDDALTKLSSDGNRVGDIKITVRTDLGDNWLLCNGVKVSRDVYEALSERVAVNLSTQWSSGELWSNNGVHSAINCITYANGYWVVGGRYRDDSKNYARIAYTTDLAGDWTIVDVWNMSNGSHINCITYENGYWVLGGVYVYNSTSYARIAYASDLAGKWTTKDIWTGVAINCIAYADGFWVVGGSGGLTARVAYASTLGGAWTNTDIWSNTNNKQLNVFCIAYEDGRWFVGGNSYEGGSYYASVAYTDDITGAWTSKKLWGASSLNSDIKCFEYANGYWVAGGSYNGTSGTARVAYTSDFTGEWTVKDMWAGGAINCIAQADGLWVVGGNATNGSTYYGKVAYTTDPTGTWLEAEPWRNTKDSPINGIAYADRRLIAVGTSYDGTTSVAKLAEYDTSVIPLPEISVDKAYAYIKAKEG